LPKSLGLFSLWRWSILPGPTLLILAIPCDTSCSSASPWLSAIQPGLCYWHQRRRLCFGGYCPGYGSGCSAGLVLSSAPCFFSVGLGRSPLARSRQGPSVRTFKFPLPPAPIRDLMSVESVHRNRLALRCSESLRTLRRLHPAGPPCRLRAASVPPPGRSPRSLTFIR
jgi:hypothetical protein